MLELHTQLKHHIAKHPLITGSFLLTLTGFISRLIGFFYRMYLSRIFGEEGMGVYQLITPVMALSFSLTAAGFQTAISKFVAERASSDKLTDTKTPHLRPLFMGLSISLPLSILCMLFLMQNSDLIADYIIHEPRTASLLRILALSIPLSAAHACISGYFYGLKQAPIPGICQLAEQLCRVLSVFFISSYTLSKGDTPSLNITVLGLIMGELASLIISATALFLHIYGASSQKPTKSSPNSHVTYSMLLAMTLPLIANRITLNLLQSVETITLPQQLQLYGYDPSTALSVYGVLTGMAFPLLFFPNALTGSFAVLLLPMISERISVKDINGVKHLTFKTIQYCSLLGFICMGFFFVLADFLGIRLFQSALAGKFIRILSFICPFLYLNNTLSAILQGMGKVIPLFFINVLSLLIRLSFILFLVPHYGIRAFLWGMLLSQLFHSISCLLTTIYSKTSAK